MNMDRIDILDTNKNFSNEELQELDMFLFFKEGGDPDFNPERNKAIIEDSIRKQRANYIKKRQMFNQELRERMNAVESYIRWIEKGHDIGAEKYFGKRELARLRGVEVANTLKNITRIEVPGYRKQFEIKKQARNRLKGVKK